MITGFILIIIHKSQAPPRPKLIAASLATEEGDTFLPDIGDGKISGKFRRIWTNFHSHRLGTLDSWALILVQGVPMIKSLYLAPEH